MNIVAFLVGLVTYVVVGTMCGLMVLGVGFMPEPSRTIYGQLIIFGPFLPTGLVVGYIARTKAIAIAAAVALIAFAVFLMLAHRPIPYILQNEAAPWVVAAQATYQVALYVGVCVLGAWLGNKARSGKRLNQLRPLGRSYNDA
jgi:hypothetical protein